MHDVSNERRRQLLAWANAALAAVNPGDRVAAALKNRPPRRVAVLALGKAAAGMMRGAETVLGAGIERALLVAPAPLSIPLQPQWEFHPGDHPLPGANSLAAGEAVAAWLRELEAGLPLLALISGGGSALAESPVPGMTLANLQRLNRWLLASGLDIHRINQVRSRFSQLKRGGVLRFAGKREIIALLISDVPRDDVVDIASGPLSPVPFAWPEESLPEWLRRLHAELPMPAANGPSSSANIRIVARNADALDAAAQAAEKAGVACVTRGALSGAAADAGAAIARQILEGPAGVHLFGGETTVRLPRAAGRGGRNQQLALAAAREIAGEKHVLLLALGTDGIDGNTQDAGALVDGGTFGRIRDAGLDASECLASANSNAALAAAGDLIHTGPTGTNVMDIVIALKTA